MIQDLLKNRLALLQTMESSAKEYDLSFYTCNMEEKLKFTMQLNKAEKGIPEEDILIILNKYFSLIKGQWSEYQTLSNNELLDKVFEVEDLSNLIFQKVADEVVVSKVTSQMISYSRNEKEHKKAKQAYKKLDLWEIKNLDESLFYIGVSSEIVFITPSKIHPHEIQPPVKNIFELISNAADLMPKIREIPAMYVGSRNLSGVYTMVFGIAEELLSIDGLNSLELEILNDQSVEISVPSIRLQTLKNNCSFLCITNFLSEKFEWQDENTYLLSEKGSVSLFEERDKQEEGLRIRFKPDSSIFSEVRTLDYYKLLKRFKELAMLNPRYTIRLKNNNNDNVLHFENGIKTMLEENLNSFFEFEIVDIDFFDGGVEGNIALTTPFSDFKADCQRSYINDHITNEGGAHVEGLLEGVREAFKKHVSKTNFLPVKNISKIDFSSMTEDIKWKTKNKRDIRREINYVINVRLDNPRFYGATKRRLENYEVKEIVKKNVFKMLLEFLEKREVNSQSY